MYNVITDGSLIVWLQPQLCRSVDFLNDKIFPFLSIVNGGFYLSL